MTLAAGCAIDEVRRGTCEGMPDYKIRFGSTNDGSLTTYVLQRARQQEKLLAGNDEFCLSALCTRP